MRSILVAFILIIQTYHLYSQCCSGGIPLAGNFGITPNEKSEFTISLSYDRNSLRDLYTESKSLADESRERLTNSHLFNISYGLTQKLNMGLSIPVVSQVRVIRSVTDETIDRTDGIGDIVAIVSYEPIKLLSLIYGFKIPSGRHDRTNEVGIPLPADLQSGSGSFDHIAMINFKFPVLNIWDLSPFGSLIYRQRGVNNSYFGENSYEFGDEWNITGGLSRQFILYGIVIDGSLSALFRSAQRDFFNAGEFPSSGGKFGFLQTGLGLPITQQHSLDLMYAIPIYTYVNEVQLVPTSRINLQLNLKINARKNDSIFQ